MKKCSDCIHEYTKEYTKHDHDGDRWTYGSHCAKYDEKTKEIKRCGKYERREE